MPETLRQEMGLGDLHFRGSSRMPESSEQIFSWSQGLVPSGRYVGNVRPLVASQGKPGVLFQKLHPPALLRRQLHFTVNPQGWENSPSEAPYGLQAQPAGGHLRTIVM